MKEYKMRRGEYLEERVPDLEGTVEEYFGPITGTEEMDGVEMFVVGEPDNPVFERILVGAATYGSKKDKLAVHFEEKPAEQVIEEGNADAAADAVDVKNDFLLEATGRDAKSRRESLKRDVEKDDVPDNV
ncbi:Uncharacterized protein HSRCO_0636 [Halanaeroarchaeum sp. HSR-CO]|uniref:DUF5611 family protein n=1 Tax=Halanaeroarchaeum sp. HSR-CO TaxID=2866382 RepID=UPI00217E804A|nr:DUF5611 family protein [Halanaeroarchaeum sp. HSR-CO]UWG46931.1 Uncharacterized protein HSRCO_0636 [Halanaeroarchaeum sp. HSR-CO]